ncbi:MAG TPA: hypothetical protein VM639_08090 [Dongiaceae bacterium]|nr:hypothetical protein [Dongiaceae bacterium]
MSDKVGPTPPPNAQPAPTQAAGQSSRADPRLAAKSKLAAATSVEVDASVSLDAASAQLSALRNQANAAAASGDLSTLQQLAVHAVAIGVAAGQNAENLANAIAAKVAASGSTATTKSKTDRGDPAATDLGATDLTALGLKPEDIARLFTQPEPAKGAAAQRSSVSGGIASSLHELAALNARAGAVITDARSLLASMNEAVGATPPSGAAESGSHDQGSPLEQGVTLNGLSQLLDQAESALTAKVYAVGQQIAGTVPPARDTGSEPKPAALNLKT